MIDKVEQNLKTPYRLIWALAGWQFFSLLMITIFNWPKAIIWLNFALLAGFILFFGIYQSLILLIVSIPFFVVLPNPYFETLSIWRPLFLLLFLVWLAKNPKFKTEDLKFLPWDRPLAYFAGISLFTALFFGRYPLPGLKQLLFFANIYIFYIVLIHAVQTPRQIYGIFKAAAGSLGIIIGLGFVQLIATFFTGLETFWVYWADNIARVFYGSPLAEVALYSNSWFSYVGGRGLRMFSVQPDSQSFAYLCVFALAFILPLTLAIRKKFRPWPWLGIKSASLAIMFSGTRAVWAGIIAPFFVTAVLFAKKDYRPFAKKILWMLAVILFFFLASPLIALGLQALRQNAALEANLIARARSIYDLNEASNAGRLLIWKESLGNFLRQPWGVGLNNFLSTLEAGGDYQTAAQALNPRYNLPQEFVTAHSLYLQILVELGLAGFAVFVWFWVKAGREISRFLKSRLASEDPLVFFVFGSALSFCWLLAAAGFDVTWFNDRVLMYFFLMLGLSGIVIKDYQKF